MVVTKMCNAYWPQDIGTCSTIPVPVASPFSSCQIQAGPTLSFLSHHCGIGPEVLGALGDQLWSSC